MKAFGLLSLLIAVALMGFFAYRMYFGTEKDGGMSGVLETKNQAVRDLAVIKAQEIYKKQEIEGVDFSSGPCIANNLIDDWVADIVHDPREAMDDLAENQCSSFREGAAHHFVELGLRGNVVRVR